VKKTRALAICFTLLVPIGAHSQRPLAPGGIIDPRLVGPTDPDYAPRFFIGLLVFKVPNRFLIFPWPTDQHPFDRSVCAEPSAVKDPAVAAGCKSDHQSVFLKIPIPGFARDAQNNGAKLGKHEYGESIGEMKDADELINRILFLDGLPNVQRLNSIGVGENVEQILKADLALEEKALGDLRAGIAYCEGIRDFVSRDLLLKYWGAKRNMSISSSGSLI
jgi:hypothetical protein